MAPRPLDGKAALVTGASRGIGKGIALSFAEAGADLLLAARSMDDLEVTAKEASAHGVRAETIHMDAYDLDQVYAAVDAVTERFGKIDVLVNNAALFANLEYQSMLDIDPALWDKVMAVNVRGPFLMAKHVVPHMKKQKHGKIINIGSGTARKGMPNLLHYVTSKGAITSMTRAMSRELGGDNICVNTLAPGLIMSDSVLESGTHSDAIVNSVVQSRALKRDAFPEDLLGALIFLASSDSDFITGQVIAVDGGSTNT
jgi:NAD(P)-dependent dehydrogenase (short-subunit alcohol dehydrogenase family)